MCECAFSLSGSRSNDSTRPNAGLCVFFFFFALCFSYIIHIPFNVTRTKLLYVSMVEWKRIQSQNTIQRIVYILFSVPYTNFNCTSNDWREKRRSSVVEWTHRQSILFYFFSVVSLVCDFRFNSIVSFWDWLFSFGVCSVCCRTRKSECAVKVLIPLEIVGHRISPWIGYDTREFVFLLHCDCSGWCSVAFANANPKGLRARREKITHWDIRKCLLTAAMVTKPSTGTYQVQLNHMWVWQEMYLYGVHLVWSGVDKA